LLHRLERLTFVESSWQSVAGERRRKYYRITNKGLAELAEQRRQWDTIVDTLREIWLSPDDRGDAREQNMSSAGDARKPAIELGVDARRQAAKLSGTASNPKVTRFRSLVPIPLGGWA
jgi:DNA-binding PadR family transcriptional regulator